MEGAPVQRQEDVALVLRELVNSARIYEGHSGRLGGLCCISAHLKVLITEKITCDVLLCSH